MKAKNADVIEKEKLNREQIIANFENHLKTIKK
jgi:hypothetical protein